MSNATEYFKQLQNTNAKLLKKHEKEITKIYSDAFLNAYKDILNEMAEAKKVGEDWKASELNQAKLAYVKQLAEKTEEVANKYNQKLSQEFKLNSTHFLKDQCPKLGDKEFLDKINKSIDITNENLITMLKRGKIYQDGKGLSERIWDTSKMAGTKMQDAIASAIATGKGPADIAQAIMEFGTEGHKTWSQKKIREKLGPTYASKYSGGLDYQALRLARTTMTHLHQLEAMHANEVNPYAGALRWHSTQHSYRTCPLCEERNGKIFSMPSAPIKGYDICPFDHPNGMCWMEPILMLDGKEITPEDVAEDLNKWIHGEKNSGVMDKAFPELKNAPSIVRGVTAAVTKPKETVKAEIPKAQAPTPAIDDMNEFFKNDFKATEYIREFENDMDEDYLKKLTAYDKEWNKYFEAEKKRLAKEYSSMNVDEAKKWAKEQYKNFRGESATYHSYVGTSNSFIMNRRLYEHEYKPGGTTKIDEQIDKVTELIAKGKLEKNTQFVRFSGSSPLNTILKDMGRPELNIDKGYMMFSRNEIKRKGSEAQTQYLAMLNSATKGKEFTFDSFTSVSYDIEENVFTNREVQMEIYAPKGLTAMYTKNHDESEVVLQRGTSFKIIGFEYTDNGKLKMIVEAIAK